MKKIVILGIHNSGSTLLAAMMHFLRINFGLAPTRGKYGFSYETPHVPMAMQHCIQFGMPIDWTQIERCKEPLTSQIHEFFQVWEPLDSAIKHPFLCAGLTVVEDELLRELTFIDCNRSLANSIEGAIEAYPKRAESMVGYQTALHEGKEKVLARARKLGCTIYDWDYDQLTTATSSAMVNQLQQFLDAKVRPEYVEKAISLYDEQQHHVGL
jgi:hypothetical protein